MKKILLSALAAAFVSSAAFAQMVPKMVLLEEFTNASCGPCASQNPAYNQLIQANWNKVVSLKYQASFPGFDPMNQQNPTEVATRRAYYGISGVPTCAMNGRIPDNSNTVGGAWSGYAGGPYGFTQAVIDDEYTIMTPIEMEMSHSISNALDSASVHVVVRNVSAMAFNASAANQLKLHLAMTEQEIIYNTAPGSNGEVDFYEVMRKMYPNDNGTTLPDVINAGDSVVFDFNVEIPSYIYSLAEIAFVAFVQDNGTSEAHQAVLSEPVAVNGPDAAIADATTAPSDYCATSVTPEVTLSNDGTQMITSAEVTLTINGGTVVENWSGNLAPGASETVTFPAQNLVDGQNEWSTSITSVNGGNDISGSNNTTPSSFAIKLPSTPSTSPYAQDFESASLGGLPANTYEENPNGIRMFAVDQSISSTVTWPLGGFGNSAVSVRWDYFNIAAGEAASILLEKIDLTEMDTASISFDHAYAQYSSENDRLQILVSDDCGATWSSVFDEAGASLSTVAPVGTGRYYPQVSEWENTEIDLSNFVGSEISVKVTGTSDFGNSLYVDNINIDADTLAGGGGDPGDTNGGNPGDTTGIGNLLDYINNVTVYPNPASDFAIVEFEVSQSQTVAITVFDVVGKVVDQVSPTVLNAGRDQIRLNTSSFDGGIYYIRIESDGEAITQKLTVSR